ADDPAYDALPREGGRADRPARDRVAGSGRRRGTAAELKAGLSGDAVHVELENGQVDDARRVLAGLDADPEQVVDGRTLVSRVPNGGRAVPAILSALEGAGITVASVSVSRPSLDDVYLHYTGREFAAEDRGE